jgi:dynein heavy chain, axonemal
MVDDLKATLIELRPEIDKKEEETQALVVDLEVRQKEAAEQEKVTAGEEAESRKLFAAVAAIKSECEAELEVAMPVYREAVGALDTLDRGDITEMKAYANPAEEIVLVISAVCLLLGKPETWDEGKKLMNNPADFLSKLKLYPKDSIKERLLTKLKKYTQDARFDPKSIAKKSKAAMSLCMWARAIDNYAGVMKVIRPKQAALAEAEAELGVAQETLRGKQAALQKVRDEIHRLQSNYQASQRTLEDLTKQKETIEVQLGRAEKLVVGLADEAQRWRETVKVLEVDLVNLVGNILLAAGYISYVGPFTAQYRASLLKRWMEFARAKRLPFSDDFAIARILGDPVLIREWNIQGLPADDLSIENGIICTQAKRWPLLIDPQSQGNRWIKSREKDNNLQTIKLSNPKFLGVVELAIRYGQPVLLENVGEVLDPSLEPVLQKNVVKRAGAWEIRLGDGPVPYSWDFSFLVTTKLPNPHYLPEICIKVTVINFTVTPDGLEDQLLVDVVAHERPELEQQKDQLVVQLSDFKRQLQDIEAKILKLVSEASEDILDDEELIITLDQSKQTSIAINERVAEAEKTAEMINENRENYRPVARRGSVLYFVIADLALIDPMYQYSLEFFARLFNRRLERSAKSEDVDARIKILLDDVTASFYANICRGLFEKDKLLYSFLNAASILRRGGQITPAEWNFYLRGSTTDFSSFANDVDYLPNATHAKLLGLEEAHFAFKDIAKSFADPGDAVTWKKVLASEEPTQIPLPPAFEERLSAFQKLMLVRVLREEKLV